MSRPLSEGEFVGLVLAVVIGLVMTLVFGLSFIGEWRETRKRDAFIVCAERTGNPLSCERTFR